MKHTESIVVRFLSIVCGGCMEMVEKIKVIIKQQGAQVRWLLTIQSMCRKHSTINE